LGYARLYDGTVAADYYRAMAEVESQLALAEGAADEAAGSGELLAMVDALHAGDHVAVGVLCAVAEVARRRSRKENETAYSWGYRRPLCWPKMNIRSGVRLESLG